MHGVVQQLKVLQLIDNNFTGALPASWAQDGSFSALQELDVSNNQINGSLPHVWGAAGTFPQLQVMALDGNNQGHAQSVGLVVRLCLAGSIPVASHLQRLACVLLLCALIYGGFDLEETGQIISQQAGASQWARRVLALVLSPLVFLLTCVMDVWSFFEAFGAPSPGMPELESYADMCAVNMPLCQSLFSAIITSVIIGLGNSPKNGLYYTVLLYTVSVVFSCAAILMGQGKLLYICHRRDRHILRTTGSLMTGKLLHPVHDGRTAAYQPSSRGSFWRWLVCGLACPRWECSNLL